MAHMSSGRWQVRRLLTSAVATLVSCSALAAPSLPDYSGSYLCIGEAGGGIYWYEDRAKFGGATFNADDKFVIKLTKQGDEPLFEGGDLMKGVYIAEISEFGAKAGQCYGTGKFGTVEMWEAERRLTCSRASTYWFDVKSLRYLRAYPYGYIEGEENNTDTAVIIGGTCAKL